MNLADFWKTTNWQTKLCGAVALACAIYGIVDDHARTLCEVFAIGVLGVGQFLGVSTGRFQNVVDVIDKYVLLYKQHPIDEIPNSEQPVTPAKPAK